MRWCRVLAVSMAVLLLCVARAASNSDDADQNEFAEFEDFEEEQTNNERGAASREQQVKSNGIGVTDGPNSAPASKPAAAASDADNAFLEDEIDEADADFDHFQDSEEFEGHDSSERPAEAPNAGPSAGGAGGGAGSKGGDLKITSVPLHLRASWQSYYVEMLICAALAVYFINFLTGRSKNVRLADAWLECNTPLLEANFALVGDDGRKEVQSGGLRKESENCFTLWCSGRQCVEGMLVELRLLRRQCLVGVIAQLMRPQADQMTYKLTLDAMEPMVFCLVTKKNAQKLTKDLVDVMTFCPDRKALPDRSAREMGDQFSVHSEIGEVTQSFFQDARLTSLLAGMKDCIEMLLVSDQYQGAQAAAAVDDPNQTLVKKPETERVVILKVSLPGRGRTSEDQMEPLTDLARLVLYLADKVSRTRLSKEARAKADKNRLRVEESFLKSTHAQRQELAQQRREERIRAERERIMAEDDPEKQRRLDLKEQKRLSKKTNPKQKQMKVRAM